MTFLLQPKAFDVKSAAAALINLETASRPAFLWAESGENLLWANDAAASFTGFNSPAELIEVPFSGTPFAAQMDSARRALQPGAERLELLRLPGKHASITFIGRLSLMQANGQMGLLIVGPELEPARAQKKIVPRRRQKKLNHPEHVAAEQDNAPLSEAQNAPPSRPVLEPHEQDNLQEIARTLTALNEGEAEIAPIHLEADATEIGELQNAIDHLNVQNNMLQNELNAARAREAELLASLENRDDSESELISARKHAEAVSDLKSEFLATVSHEIRSPLNAIIGFSEVMLEERFGPVGSERYKQYIKDIHSSGGFLLNLVNDLLDLSKIEAGKIDLSFAPLSLGDLALDCINLLQEKANSKGVILRSSLQSVPLVYADARSLRQILLNLLSNAIKFTPDGGQVIVSTLRTAQGSVSLRVRDTGIGMTDLELNLALEPFQQLRASEEKSREKGTGLGLPLSKALAEANQAQFAIVSEPKKGTLVSITFPASHVLEEDEA